jgi:hypothetical protein
MQWIIYVTITLLNWVHCADQNNYFFAEELSETHGAVKSDEK